MKKVAFISLFIITHITFIFLQIHKHMAFIKQSFAKQKNERLLESLHEKKQEIINQFYALKNRATIKTFAQQNLQMNPIHLHQIKRLHNNDQHA